MYGIPYHSMKTVTQVITELKAKQDRFVGDWDQYDKLGEAIDILDEYS